MGLLPVVIAVVAILIFLCIGRRGNAGKQRMLPASRANPGSHRMTNRRKLREILECEEYESLTDWEKTFCNDVNRQKTRLTWAQAEKIDEIWSGINESRQWNTHYRERCTAASMMLKEIIESPSFHALPEKEKKYMQKIYDEGEVTGSYRIGRIHELHTQIIGGQACS